ncbi:glutathione S-transferase-like [Fagus crenata]
MAVRKVYGSLNSPATLKVLACLFEHDLDFEFVPVNLDAGEQKKKAFLSINPFGQVPVYEDGGIKQFAQNGLAPDQGVVAEAEAKLGHVLDVYETQLSKFKYLASDKYTIVDVIHLPNLQSLMGMPAKKLIESRPRVRAWCSESLARPAWAKVLEMKHKAQAYAAS